jgi:hypothetical protein
MIMSLAFFSKVSAFRRIFAPRIKSTYLRRAYYTHEGKGRRKHFLADNDAVDWNDNSSHSNEGNRKKFTFRELPDETLFIMDGTAMIHHAYYSREHQSDWQSAVLTKDLSINLIEELGLDKKSVGEGEVEHGGDEVDLGQASDSESADVFASIEHPRDDLLAVDEEGEWRVRCGALTAMLMHFVRFVRDVRPRYLAVAFDVEKKTFRNEIYPAYKEHRKGVSKAVCMYVLPRTRSYFM